MAYKDAQDNKHNASMAKMMGKIRNPLNSPAEQNEDYYTKANKSYDKANKKRNKAIEKGEKGKISQRRVDKKVDKAFQKHSKRMEKNSPAQQRPVGKTKEDIGDRTRTIKTKKSGKTIVKDKFDSKKDTKSGDILKERSVHRADGSSKRKRKYKGLGTQKLKFGPTNDED